MVLVFVLGTVTSMLAPLLRRSGPASGVALAGGASMLIFLAIAGLVHSDPRQGLAAIDANRREYFFILACEVPVLILALVSAKRGKMLFWVAWGIHAAFAACVVAILIWLEYFWHW